MKLPQVEKLVVEQEKVAEYLLNGAHPDNGGKAAFFLACDFHRADWALLAGALRQVAVWGDVVTRVSTAHGTKYVVDGRMETPSGRTVLVRTVWIVDLGWTRRVLLPPSLAKHERSRCLKNTTGSF